MIVELDKEVKHFDVNMVVADSESYEDFYGLYTYDDYDYDSLRPLSLLEAINYFIQIDMTNDRLERINQLAGVLTENQCRYEFAFLWMMTDSRFPIEEIIIEGGQGHFYEITRVSNLEFTVEPWRQSQDIDEIDER